MLLTKNSLRSFLQCGTQRHISRERYQYPGLLPRKHGLDIRKEPIKAAILDPVKDLDIEDNADEFDDYETSDIEDSFTSQQVQSLVNVVCAETEFAEIEMKIGNFALKVRRHITGDPAKNAEDSYGPVIDAAPVALPSSANELPFQSTASIDESQIISPPSANGSSISSMDEDDFDENLLFIGAPKVGILRRGRYIKGRRVGKGPIAEEGSRVKKGQPLAFIEQLGTFVPIEAPQAGEIASFNIEDGKAVEYKEVIVEIAPFFGGHIIGDKKYA